MVQLITLTQTTALKAHRITIRTALPSKMEMATVQVATTQTITQTTACRTRFSNRTSSAGSTKDVPAFCNDKVGIIGIRSQAMIAKKPILLMCEWVCDSVCGVSAFGSLRMGQAAVFVRVLAYAGVFIGLLAYCCCVCWAQASTLVLLGLWLCKWVGWMFVLLCVSAFTRFLFRQWLATILMPAKQNTHLEAKFKSRK